MTPSRLTPHSSQPVPLSLAKAPPLPRCVVSDQEVYSQLGVNSIPSLGPLDGRKVYLRVDANVLPSTKLFSDHPRIKQFAGTLNILLKQGAKVLVASHHSKGAPTAPTEGSKRGVVARFKDTHLDLAQKLHFLEFLPEEIEGGVVNEQTYLARAMRILDSLPEGEALFIENTRLLPSERHGASAPLATEFAQHLDLLVYDGFGVGHRSGHLSVDGLSRLLPFERKALGPSCAHEWRQIFDFVLDAEPASMALVIGGDKDKFGTKVKLLERLLDTGMFGVVYLGGVFGTTFLASQGAHLGRTPVCGEERYVEMLSHLPTRYPLVHFETPHELRGYTDQGEVTSWKKRSSKSALYAIPDRAMALDQAPSTLSPLLEHHGITRVLAVGPLGHYIVPPFNTGTLGTYRHLAHWASEDNSRKLLVGGGNSIEALLSADEFQDPLAPGVMISSGGGALLNAVVEALRSLAERDQVLTPAVKALRRG